jgi:hypothetical protein
MVGLKLRPTVDTEKTFALNEAGISVSNLIRFKNQLVEKLGGWLRFYPFNLAGVPKDIHPWADLNAVSHLGIGTTTELVVITEGDLQDITPQTLVSDFAPDFSTTINTSTVEVTDPNIANVTTYDSIFFNTPIAVGGLVLEGLYPIDTITGVDSYTIVDDQTATATVANGGAVPQFVTTAASAIVTVNFAAHGRSVGGTFTFPIPTTGDGVTITGTYSVLSVPTANSFTISANNQATAGATFSMNGGNSELVYYIAIGPSAAGSGYGLGGYGDGGYGTGTTSTSQTGTPITAVNWSLDNWGEILLACPKNGGIYQWSPDGGFLQARLIPAAPVFNGGIFVAMPEQILVAWASIASGEQQDPLTIRWSDSLDYTNWTVTITTQAGSFRIPTGSMIVGGIQGPQQALIWTDLDVWAMQYIGPPLVFGFNKISSGCGLIGQHAVCTMRGIVYWMSSGNFFQLSGNGVQEIPCSVWDVIFQNLDTAHQDKCIMAANSMFDEITCYYPSASGGSGEIDSYAKYNTTEGSWDYGTLARTAWTDQSVLGQPIGTTPQGAIYQHETSPDADGQPLNASFTTGWFVIAEGEEMAFVDWLFPDMKWGLNGGIGATVQLLIEVATYPNSAPISFGPFNMTSAKDFINLRLRGRLIRLTFSSSDIGSFWRVGLPRYRVAQDGRR